MKWKIRFFISFWDSLDSRGGFLYNELRFVAVVIFMKKSDIFLLLKNGSTFHK